MAEKTQKQVRLPARDVARLTFLMAELAAARFSLRLIEGDGHTLGAHPGCVVCLAVATYQDSLHDIHQAERG